MNQDAVLEVAIELQDRWKITFSSSDLDAVMTNEPFVILRNLRQQGIGLAEFAKCIWPPLREARDSDSYPIPKGEKP